ncbi:MAG: hypothetical protein P8Q14_00795 [Vicingaceae bacterium]|nr:hypothetical protein [Vicingaceae bacterium]
MKYLLVITLIFSANYCFSQDEDFIKTEGEITEITFHQGKRARESAIIKFNLENGTEQLGSVDLFRIPFIGSMKTVGDKITIKYNKNNPALLETVFGNFLSIYGMYILILLGIIFSLKPIFNYKKSINTNT